MTCIGREQNTTKRFLGIRPQKIWGEKTTYLLKENRVHQHLWMDLCETLTYDVYRSAVVYYEEIFWVLAPNRIWEPRIYLFLITSQLHSKFEGQYLRQGTWWRQSGKSVGNYRGSRTSSQNFINVGPLTTKMGHLFLPTLQKFCILCNCRASHTQLSRQNSTTPQKIGVQKLWTYFWRLHNSNSTLSANISSVKIDRDNRETAFETTKFGH